MLFESIIIGNVYLSLFVLCFLGLGWSLYGVLIFI